MSDSSLGCYSVIRYRDALSDQQVNLGLLLWHPHQGYRVFLLPNPDVARAIAPKLEMQDLKFRLNVIEEEIAQNGKLGPEKFQNLSSWFRDGVEVTSPYPAKFTDLESALQLLRPTLFPQAPEEPKALALLLSRALSIGHVAVSQFEKKIFKTIEKAAGERHIQAHPIPPRKVGRLTVSPGLQTIAGRHKALWRVVSFRSNEKPESQVSHAKNVFAEMHILAQIPQFREHDRLVVVPAEQSQSDEPRAWLARAATHVWSVETPEGAERLLDRAMKPTS
jgi:hypothetical protein